MLFGCFLLSLPYQPPETGSLLLQSPHNTTLNSSLRVSPRQPDDVHVHNSVPKLLSRYVSLVLILTQCLSASKMDDQCHYDDSLLPSPAMYLSMGPPNVHHSRLPLLGQRHLRCRADQQHGPLRLGNPGPTPSPHQRYQLSIYTYPLV